jgi:hypothetical protein
VEFLPSNPVPDMRMHDGVPMQGRTRSTKQSRIIAEGSKNSTKEPTHNGTLKASLDIPKILLKITTNSAQMSRLHGIHEAEG